MARKALGRGLEALLGKGVPDQGDPEVSEDAAVGSGLREVPVDDISPNPEQPRQHFDEDALGELADSIAARGVLQPLLVSQAEEGGFFLIAGERRWQAARRAGLKKVPCLIKEAAPADRLALALIENIQRQDLNPLEEAEAYTRLSQDYGLSQEDIAGAVGRDRATVANYMRLIRLPEAIQGDLVAGRLTMGHARALLGLLDRPEQLSTARTKVLHDRLNVRQTERLVDRLRKPIKPRPPQKEEVVLKAESDDLRRRLGTKVSIAKRGDKGKIVIEFFSDAELDRLLDWFKSA